MKANGKARAGDAIRWREPLAILRKFDDSGKLLDVVVSQGNIITTAGWQRLVNVFAGASGVEGLHDESCRLGVGDNNVSAHPDDTSLSDVDNEWYQELDEGYPAISGELVVFKATFGTEDANFTWACWGLDVDDTTPVSSSDTPADLFNRKVFNFGTKDGGIWDLSVIIGFTQ